LLRSDFDKNPAEALQWLVGRPEAELAAMRTAGFAINNVGTLEFQTVQTALSHLEKQEDRDWLLASYHTGHSRKEPLAALEALSTSVNDSTLRAAGITFILSGSVREGSEAELEPWIAAQPAKEQEALRKQIAEWKANAAKKDAGTGDAK
jgi:hypothetical protein